MANKSFNNEHWKVLVLLLKNVAHEKNITHQEIAEKTGLIKSNVERLFALKYSPSLLVFLAVANAVGVNFYFEDKEEKSDLSIMFEKAMTELGRRPDKLNNQN